MMPPARSFGGARRKVLLLLSLVTIAALVVVVAATATRPASASAVRSVAAACQRGGTLSLATDITPTGLDPTTGLSDLGSEQADFAIYDTLIENRGTQTAGDLQPGLAKSWSVSPSGLKYTFHLRPGVKFADGSPFTSADVVFSVNRLSDPKLSQEGALYSAFIKSVTAPDPMTAVISLKKVTPALTGWLSTGWAGIVPKAYYEKVGAKAFAAHPIGTGPFKFVQWLHGQSMTIERNPYYWKSGQPYFDKLVFQFIPNDNTRILNVRSGATDIAIDVPFSQLGSLAKESAGHLVVTNESTFDPLLINNSKPPFNEKAVRQALNYATPKAVINKIVFSNKAIIANSTLPPMHYWNRAQKPYPYDLNKARALLKQSSVPNGFNMNLAIVGTDQAEQLTAGIIQNAWAQIGVKVKIVQLDFGSVINLLVKEKYDGLLQPPTQSQTDMPLDDELALFVDSPAGPIDSYFTHYSNPAVTKLIEQAVTSRSEAKRTALFHRVQQMTLNDAFFVPLVFAPSRAFVRNDISGFKFVSTNWYYLGGVCRT
jgi:peptide/nickel transport system substrate-binding protein